MQTFWLSMAYTSSENSRAVNGIFIETHAEIHSAYLIIDEQTNYDYE